MTDAPNGANGDVITPGHEWIITIVAVVSVGIVGSVALVVSHETAANSILTMTVGAILAVLAAFGYRAMNGNRNGH